MFPCKSVISDASSYRWVFLPVRHIPFFSVSLYCTFFDSLKERMKEKYFLSNLLAHVHSWGSSRVVQVSLHEQCALDWVILGVTNDFSSLMAHDISLSLFMSQWLMSLSIRYHSWTPVSISPVQYAPLSVCLSLFTHQYSIESEYF